MKSKRAREAVSAVEAEKPVDVQMADEPSSKKRKRDTDDVEVKDKSKKDKKDKKKKHKGETRKEKKDKRKDLQDLPEQDEPEDEEETAEAPAEVVKDEKASKKEKKDKKDKKKEKKESEQQEDAVDAKATDEKKKTDKKEKKDKKDKKDKKNKDKTNNGTSAAETTTNGTSNDQSQGEGEGIDLDESSSKKNDRHIVFVGNLPYTATAATISAHFASLSPIAVRCLTKKGEKDPKVTCKGIAFVEFANVWTQRTCLDKFHHSMFDDKKSAARRINVELTAGGGGKNTNRHEKIAEKNRKLDENRAKRIDREKTTKAESAATHLDDAIHPSRRGRVPGSG